MPFPAWFKKASGPFVRNTLRAVPAKGPDTFLNHAPPFSLVRATQTAVKQLASRCRRAKTAICPEGWAYLALLVLVLYGAMVREVNLLLMLAGLMLGPVVFSWRLVVAMMRGLEVRRKMPGEICAGDLLVVHVELANAKRRRGAWAVVAEDRIERESDGDSDQPARPAVYFPYVAAGTTDGQVYRGRLNRRGRYRLGPIRLSSRFPFGLFRRAQIVAREGRLTVFPRLGRLTQRWVARRHEDFEGTQRCERHYGRIQGDFYGVRPWRTGDNRRWIHWRASARHGALVVRQFEQHRNRDVAVLVELWQPDRPSPEHLDNVELAVSFAATVLDDLCRKGGSNVLLGTTGPRPWRRNGPASAALLTDVMQRLAVVEAESRDRLPALLQAALAKIEPGTEIVLVSTRGVDLSDAQRFGRVQDDPSWRSAMRRVRVVDTSDGTLGEYFQAE